MEPPRRPVTDSPWFWAYLFSTAALVSLALIGPKYGSRQAQIERQSQGRQQAASAQPDPGTADGAEQPPGEADSTSRDLRVSLRPLWLGLAAITTIAWIIFWRGHIARQGAVTSLGKSS